METPAPTSYNQETSKQAKLARFDNIHLGTDIKMTAKEIKLTPGPGHYVRVDEQYPRTFHHPTKHGSQRSPVFSSIVTKGPSKAGTVEVSHDTDDFSKAKRKSGANRQASTGQHFFGPASGAE